VEIMICQVEAACVNPLPVLLRHPRLVLSCLVARPVEIRVSKDLFLIEDHQQHFCFPAVPRQPF
jgi:hypothetical protein